MLARAQITLLPDGRRLHMHDGPIDLIVEAFGSSEHVRTAYTSASARFEPVLDELCAELSLLRRSPSIDHSPDGVIAQRMVGAVSPYFPQTFITPMAAVAGAVAEEILHAMTSTATLEKAYVNDGGDIAIHLGAGQQFVIGMVERPDRPSLFGTATITADQPIRGIATSGWRGRSFSLGIADAVTVLADTASMADAAATLIANAVDLPGHQGIRRVRACDLAPDNDLGERLVTQWVGSLTDDEIATALSGGEEFARSLLPRCLIRAAALHLQGQTRVISDTLQLATPTVFTSEKGLVHA
jgi:ApbE superfamily uncharacterized protein (UPF0280 family)